MRRGKGAVDLSCPGKEKKIEVYEVADIEEGVELANKFKDDATYDWFRGQTRGWAPHSSLYRLQHGSDAEDSIAANRRRLPMFFSWLSDIPELCYLLEPKHVHSAFAIIQHYGIPTHYIDFSTDPGVAGFFAADTKTPPVGEKSCIYCLDSRDLMGVWNAVKDVRKGASIELIRIDVQNLWRLQAQRGVFVFADYNWQVDYPMAKIVFPYSGYPSYPTAGEIYPRDKSPLEQLLDQYFSLEQSRLTNGRMRKMFDELKAKGRAASYTECEAFPGGFLAKAFVDSAKIVPLASWDPAALEAWNVSPTQDYHEVVGPDFAFADQSRRGSRSRAQIGRLRDHPSPAFESSAPVQDGELVLHWSAGNAPAGEPPRDVAAGLERHAPPAL